MNGLTLWRHARLATLAGSAPWGWIERGALLVDGERIAWVGAEADLPPALQHARPPSTTSAARSSRPAWSTATPTSSTRGQRAREFELRLEGASYEEIARAGGGIRSTVAATRAASDDDAVRRSRCRALAR